MAIAQNTDQHMVVHRVVNLLWICFQIENYMYTFAVPEKLFNLHKKSWLTSEVTFFVALQVYIIMCNDRLQWDDDFSCIKMKKPERKAGASYSGSATDGLKSLNIKEKNLPTWW